MNAGVLTPLGAAVFFLALRWAFKKVGAAPTTRMVLLFGAGCCLSVSLGAWVVETFTWFRQWGTDAMPPALASGIVAIPGAVAAITGIFFGYHLPKRRTPTPRDEWSGFILPLVLVIGVGGALGTVGDSIRHGTADTAVKIATFAVSDEKP